MIPVVAVMPFVIAVLYMVAARRRAQQAGTVYPMTRAVLFVVLAGGAGAVVAVLVAQALR